VGGSFIFPIMTALDSYLILRALVDEFARSGMQHACTSPGSRNTPIVLSLARDERIRCWSHLDERSAGFFALGAAKASGRPVAVTCTSGTAAANLLPAVIEAREARVPLIVLTADRPPELREIGAGQTIDQIKLYGDAVKWFFELGIPEATAERLRWVRTLGCRAVWTALDGRPGPVHLNIPLREPLVLDEPLPDDDTARPDGHPYVIVEPPGEVAATGGPGPHPSGRLLVVAGTGMADPSGVAEYAARTGIPVLADPMSGARRGGAAIVHYDLLLRDAGFAQAHQPDFVFRLGDLPTSKPLRAWLAGLADVPQIAFDPEWNWHDPGSVVGMRLRSRLPQPEELNVAEGWLRSWRSADDAIGRALAPVVDAELSEPSVAAWLGRELPGEASLFVASSMPVRDLEGYAPARDDPPRVLSNRGANGIDGTVSSAFGVAAVSSGPMVLLIGDLAVLHDLGGLLAARRSNLRLTIVVLNNDGGGIFHFLPVASQGEVFEEHIATPTGVEFGAVAALFGCAYEHPVDLAEFGKAMSRSLKGDGTTIIEVRTNRVANRELHRELEQAALAAVARASNR
jgi:2-succinyl-5-enolpyruvyl-6-hydroxy-3-cyclohexene-1-carboxylate synthase